MSVTENRLFVQSEGKFWEMKGRKFVQKSLVKKDGKWQEVVDGGFKVIEGEYVWNLDE